MTNDELLIAISNMMVEKLDANLTPMRNDIAVVKDKVVALEDRFSALEDRFTALEVRVASLETDMAVMKDKVFTLETKVIEIQLTQENDVLPRLQTIESCYTGTYDRYLHDAVRMETAFEDIDMLKTVVTEHSEKLKYVS